MMENIPFLKHLYSIYKYRRLIKKLAKKGLIKAGFQYPDIVVLGRAGVGKTMLVNRLKDVGIYYETKFPGVSRKLEYDVVDIESNPHTILVIPGQKFTERDLGIQTTFEEGKKIDGIIYVVDWGYTTLRDDVIRQTLIDSGIDSIEKIRQINIESEIIDFSEIVNKISNINDNDKLPKWLIILITKVDLFESKLVLAKSHYHPNGNSEFSKLLIKLNENTNNNIRMEMVTTSSTIDSYSWGNATQNSEHKTSEYHVGKFKEFVQNLSEIIK